MMEKYILEYIDSEKDVGVMVDNPLDRISQVLPSGPQKWLLHSAGPARLKPQSSVVGIEIMRGMGFPLIPC